MREHDLIRKPAAILGSQLRDRPFRDRALNLGVQEAFTGARLKTHLMPVSRLLSAVLLLGALAMPASAAEMPAHRRACLTKAEQRAAVAAHRAIPLGQAIKSLHKHGKRAEVVRARLCRHGERLVYVLTLLARNGKVTRARVDAGDGELINGR
jgi:hypothetical protein